MKQNPETEQSIIPLNESLGFLINGLARLLRTELEMKLKTAGLTPTTWTILLALAEGGITSQTDLGHQTFLDGATVTRAVDILEAKGYISRHRDDSDRRVQVVTLTSEGRVLASEVSRYGDAVNEEATKSLSLNERLNLEDMARKMISYMRENQNNGADHDR